MQILDYAGGYPGARAIRAAGYGGVIRYLRKEGTSWVRPITADELDDMRDHDLAVALVYQAVSTSRILSGRAGGRHDAQWALARARDIGVPEPRAIYFACDRDIVGGAQLAQVMAYLDGAATVLGRARVGVYGEHDVVEAALPGHAAYGWQTAAWSGGRRSREAHLYQRIGQPLVGGIPVDVNDVLKPDFGQIDMEDDMPTAQEIANAVWNTELDMGWKRKPTDPENHKATARTVLSWEDRRQQAIARQIATLSGQVASQGETLRQLAADRGLDLAEISETTEAAVKRALEESTVHVDIDVTGPSEPA